MDEIAVLYHSSASYFMEIWRQNPLVSHIKLRRHLKFALCDECVRFRELQMLHMSTVERDALRRAQVLHQIFVKK